MQIGTMLPGLMVGRFRLCDRLLTVPCLFFHAESMR